MRKTNIGAPDFTRDDADPPGSRPAYLKLGPLLEASQLGATIYELPPGESLCPYHFEWGEEEWLLVLDGQPTIRHPDGEDRLEPWDVVMFPVGPEGAHQVRNDTDSRVRVFMFSTVVLPSATTYPDSDKVGVWSANRDENLIVPRSAGVDYWHGEPAAED